MLLPCNGDGYLLPLAGPAPDGILVLLLEHHVLPEYGGGLDLRLYEGKGREQGEQPREALARTNGGGGEEFFHRLRH